MSLNNYLIKKFTLLAFTLRVVLARCECIWIICSVGLTHIACLLIVAKA